MNSPKEVGKRLIAFRLSKGFDKQADFLRAILEVTKEGITQGKLSHWENGRFMPEYDSLLLVKKAFPDLDIDFIYTGKTISDIQNLKEVVKLHPRNEDPKTEPIAEPKTWIDEKIKHLEEVIKLKDEIIDELRNNRKK